jgi:hypothetical protein
MSSGRLVCTTAFGKPKYAEMALGLARSLIFIGDRTPRAIMTDIEGVDWERYFDVVIRKSIPPEEMYWSRFFALEHTDFKHVLCIDSDCLAFKRLAPIFDAFQGAGYGVQGLMMNTGDWYDKDLGDLCREQGVKAIPKFNGGLMYIEPGDVFESVFAKAKENRDRFFELGFKTKRVSVPDEPCFALAMAQLGVGRTIHDSENFQNSGVGLVGKLRLNVLKNECRYVCRRYDLQYVEPYTWHAHYWAKFTIYWRELKRLEQIERFGDSVTVHYRQPFHSLKRSIQKRFIKLFWGVD